MDMLEAPPACVPRARSPGQASNVSSEDTECAPCTRDYVPVIVQLLCCTTDVRAPRKGRRLPSGWQARCNQGATLFQVQPMCSGNAAHRILFRDSFNKSELVGVAMEVTLSKGDQAPCKPCLDCAAHLVEWREPVRTAQHCGKAGSGAPPQLSSSSAGHPRACPRLRFDDHYRLPRQHRLRGARSGFIVSEVASMNEL